MYWNVVYGIRNLWRWLPVVWRDRDYDWAFLATMMEKKLRLMGDCLERGYHVGRERDAKRVRICAALLKRLLEDEYFVNAGYSSETWGSLSGQEARRIVAHSEAMARQDQEYLGKMIAKHLRSWWD